MRAPSSRTSLHSYRTAFSKVGTMLNRPQSIQ